MTLEIRKAWLTFLLVLLCIVPFIHSLGGEFTWDDKVLIQYNSAIQSLDRLPLALSNPFWGEPRAGVELNPVYEGVYRPFVTLIHALEYTAFSGKPFGFRIINLLLHLGSTLLVVRWLRRRFANAQVREMGVFAAACLFALHPTRAEPVAWISGSSDLWMAFLSLIALEFWDRRRDRAFHTWFAALFFGLAFLSKEVAITLIALITIDVLLQGTLRKELPHLLSVGGFVSLITLVRFILVPIVSAHNSAGWFDRLLLVLGSYGSYFEILVWPWEPSAQRGLRLLSCEGAYVPPLHVILLGMGLFLVTTVLALGSLSRQAWRPWLSDLLWFLIPLAPVANIIDLNATTLISERFMYLPMLGCCALALRFWVFSASRLSQVSRVSVLGGLVLAGIWALTMIGFHAQHFKSDQALWEYQYDLDPRNPTAIRHRAASLIKETRFKEATQILARGHEQAKQRCDFKASVRLGLMAAAQLLPQLSEGDQTTLNALRSAYENLESKGEFSFSTADFQIEFELGEAGRERINRWNEDYQLPFATVLMRTFHFDQARQRLTQVVSDNPKQASAWNLLMLLEARAGNQERVEKIIKEAREHLPDNRSLGLMYERIRKQP